MIPEILQSTEPRQVSVWGPVIGMIILFLGMNVRFEFRIQKEEKEK